MTESGCTALKAYAHRSPDCRDGKHSACTGDGWCTVRDTLVPCSCSCHLPVAVAS